MKCWTVSRRKTSPIALRQLPYEGKSGETYLSANLRFPGDTNQEALKCTIFCFTRLMRTTFPSALNFGAYTLKRRGRRVSGVNSSWRVHPIDGAVLLFRGDSPEVAEKFAQADPYVVSGAVKRWYVREWTTVAGEGAATPIRPNTAAGKEGLHES